MKDENNKIKSDLVIKENDKLIKVTSALDISKKIVSESLFRVSEDYQSIIIGEQEWMLKNLDVPHFQNGDLILEAQTSEEWQEAIDQKQPAWCYYENNLQNKEQFGKLYNGYVILDDREIAPHGWKVPSREDWDSLINHFGDDKKATQLIQSCGFNPIFSGHRSRDFLGDKKFHFEELNSHVLYISSTLNTSMNGLLHFGFYLKNEVLNIDRCILGFERGYAIKCLKIKNDSD